MTIPVLQVVQEYERAVIFRLGRLRSGGAKVDIDFMFSETELFCRAPGSSSSYHALTLIAVST